MGTTTPLETSPLYTAGGDASSNVSCPQPIKAAVALYTTPTAALTPTATSMEANSSKSAQ